jgi:acetyl esterase/lipase
MNSTERRAEEVTGVSWSSVEPLSREDAATVAAMRGVLLPHKGQLQGTAARKPFDEIMERTPAAEGVTYEADTVGDVKGWWCRPVGARPDEAILYLHGGWYVWGTALAYRHLAGQIAARAGAAVFVADYRRAPEHPFPAAVLDAQATYRGLVERGLRRIAVVGDSAGGGLALALLSLTTAVTAPGGVVPVGAVALSPVTDLTLVSPSWASRADADLYFTRPQVAALVAAYMAGQDRANPLASPLYGKLDGLPPILVHVGGDEVLLDDSLLYVARAVSAGVNAKVAVWHGMQHVFPSGVGTLNAASKSLDAIGAFLSARLAIGV